MSEKEEKGWFERKWNDPVWSKVIANFYWYVLAAIGAGIGGFVTWVLPGGWGAAWAWVKTAWHWVGASSTPNWLLLILGLGTAGFIFLLVVLVLAARRAAQNAIKPELKFMGLVWRWQIRSRADRDEMVNVLSFCPECEMQIHPARFRDVPRNHTKFICDGCPGRPVRLDYEGEPEEVYDLVIREAQRQMRKGILGKVDAPMPDLTPQISEELELIFENLKWKWQFRGKQLVNVRVFCPACSHSLQPTQENQYCPTLYTCPSCRGLIKAYHGTHSDLQDRLARQVLSGGY